MIFIKFCTLVRVKDRKWKSEAASDDQPNNNGKSGERLQLDPDS